MTNATCSALIPASAVVWLAAQNNKVITQPSAADLIPTGYGAGVQPQPLGPLVTPAPDQTRNTSTTTPGDVQVAAGTPGYTSPNPVGNSSTVTVNPGPQGGTVVMSEGSGGDLSGTPSPALVDSPYSPANVDIRVRPPYQSNPAHDTGSSLYNPNKTPEPADAQGMYELGAVRGGMGTWYAKGENGYYQYFSDNAGTVHFSGTVPTSKIPKSVLNLLEK